MFKIFGFARKLKKHQKEWHKQNFKLGIELGYPKCCVNAFCSLPPVFLRWMRIKNIPNATMVKRYNAACVNGEYTGFIPCLKCANKVLSGKTTLEKLIKNRNILIDPFPNY